MPRACGQVQIDTADVNASFEKKDRERAKRHEMSN